MTPQALDDLERTIQEGLVLPPATRSEILRLIAEHRELRLVAVRIYDADDGRFPVQPCGYEEFGDCLWCGEFGPDHAKGCPWPEIVKVAAMRAEREDEETGR